MVKGSSAQPLHQSQPQPLSFYPPTFQKLSIFPRSLLMQTVIWTSHHFVICIERNENPDCSVMELRKMRTPGQAHCYRPSAFPGQLKPGICISILCQASTRYIIINTSLPGERYFLMLDWVNIRESHTCICYPKRPDDGSLKHAKTLLLSLSYKFHELNPASFVLSVFCLIMWQEHAVLCTKRSW